MNTQQNINQWPFALDDGSQAQQGNGFGLGDMQWLQQYQNQSNETRWAGANPLQLDPRWAKKNPDKAQGKLIKNQWQDFLNRYAPIEQETLARITNFDFSRQAAQAGRNVAAQFGAQQAALGRNMSRFGLAGTARQMGAAEDALQRQRALGIAGAENMTRRNLRDKNLGYMGTMANVGKGIAADASQGMNVAGNMAANRELAGEQAKKQQTAGMIGSAASGAAMGFSFGGPIGAAIGGGIGLLLGAI